jgi:phosphoribosyl 1,2-cyclic phosphodiesterase
LRVRVWGCRGSLPTPGPETVRFGGNTSCVEVNLGDDTLLILDAGSGIRALGVELGTAPRLIHLCLTHLHLDHIEGLGHFAPIWSPETELHIWGPPSSMRGIAARVVRYFSPPLFPMQLADVAAHVVFHDAPREWEIGGARIVAERVLHPGPTLGYRIEEGGRVLAFMPDHEPGLGSALAARTHDWISGIGIAEGADVLFHDGQYSEEEYESKYGWGHSNVRDAVDFAQVAGAGKLVLFHHDPLHTDEDVAELGDQAAALWSNGGSEPEPAAEGMELEL